MVTYIRCISIVIFSNGESDVFEYLVEGPWNFVCTRGGYDCSMMWNGSSNDVCRRSGWESELFMYLKKSGWSKVVFMMDGRERLFDSDI